MLKSTSKRTGRPRAVFKDRHGKPTCPTWVKDKDARAEWRRLTKVLSNMGLVGAADSNLLVRYCIAWVRWRRVVQVLASNSGAEFATFKDSDGKIKSMQISALHSAARSLADELSPSVCPTAS